MDTVFANRAVLTIEPLSQSIKPNVAWSKAERMATVVYFCINIKPTQL